LLLSASVP